MATPAKESQETCSSVNLWESRRFKSGGNRFRVADAGQRRGASPASPAGSNREHGQARVWRESFAHSLRIMRIKGGLFSHSISARVTRIKGGFFRTHLYM